MLFAYLVANRGRPVSRDELMGALWPETAPAAPGPALSTLLARLRPALGEGILEGRHELCLRLPPDAWIDLEVAAAQAAYAEDSLTNGNLGAALEAGREALALAQRPLLPEFTECWVEERRRELRELKLTVLDVCARAGLARGGPALRAAERDARMLVSQSPYRESGYALLMRICAARGDLAEALRVYDTLRVLLRDELGATPSPALVELNDRLLVTQTPPPLARASELPLPRPLALAAREQLVGRVDELEQLRSCWERQGDEPRLALVMGEAGIGKTHLIASFARDAHAAGATVLFGRCDEESPGPYQPLLEALNGLPPEARGLGPSGPDGQGRQVFDASVGALRDIAAERPLLVVLDDVQWADKASLLLVRHLLRSLDGVRAMLILACRAVHAPASRSLAALLADLRRERDLEHLTLEGLAENEVAALVRVRGAHGAGESLPSALWRKTSGNPFLVVEALRGLHQVEALPDATEVDLDQLGALDGVTELVLQLTGWDRAARKVLEAASVEGTEFRLQVLERVLGEPAERLLEPIENLIDAGLVVEVRDQIDHFAFRHPLVRHALHEQILASRRLRLARSVALALGTSTTGLATTGTA
jgi:DNA-binding SARP family transcriptional activator